jgi:uncharacterized surface protein with fasciclin (FAS1) repeats
VGAGSFTTVVAALTQGDLIETLEGVGPFTLVVPTDEAFAKIPAGEPKKLLSNKEQLNKVPLFHVVSGQLPASGVVERARAGTVEGHDFRIRTEDGAVSVNGVKVVQADMTGTNGVIREIDKVIMPAELSAAPARKSSC